MSIKPFWESLSTILINEEDGIEQRSFRSIGTITIVLLILLTLINIVIGTMMPALLASIATLVMVFVFIASRFKKYFAPAILTFSILSYVVVIANFMVNDGISGPTLLFALLSFVLLMAVIPETFHLLAVAAHTIMGLGLLLVDYFRPEWIIGTYENEFMRYIDFAFSYVVALIFIYAFIRNIRRYYSSQREKAEAARLKLLLQQKKAKQQANKLEHTNKINTLLIALLSHDVRSPLHSISSYLELLKAEAITKEEQAEVTERLIRVAEQTDVMLLNMINWSRSQQDGFTPNFQQTSIKSTVASALDTLKAAADAKNIDLNASLEDCTFSHDPEMVKLVVRNIANNAIKFSKPTASVLINGKENGQYYTITIQDFGGGIPEDVQENLFTAFGSSHKGTGNEKGTGLGLYLSKSFVEMQGGTIDLTSVQGKGTTFSIHFPLRQDKTLSFSPISQEEKN